MVNYIKKYCEIVRISSDENQTAIKLLFDNRLYKKVVGTLREELELYVKTLYLLNQSVEEKEVLLSHFFENKQWQNEQGKRLTDREMLEYASKITGYGWEKISYKFACCFIHFSILHNWDNDDDITAIINYKEKQIIIDYINQYHNANLNLQSSFTDIIDYSLDIFKKIKDNMECYLKELEKC